MIRGGSQASAQTELMIKIRTGASDLVESDRSAKEWMF